MLFWLKIGDWRLLIVDFWSNFPFTHSCISSAESSISCIIIEEFLKMNIEFRIRNYEYRRALKTTMFLCIESLQAAIMNEATKVRSNWKGEQACSCGSEWCESTAKHITNTYNNSKGMSNCLVQWYLLFFD